jgi:hypothetical protein
LALVSDRRFSTSKVSVRSPTLGAKWDDPKPGPLNPRLRSGVPEQLGAHLHVHLRDESTSLASSHLLTAMSFLGSTEVLQLGSDDPALEVAVDVEQHIPDLGPIDSDYRCDLTLLSTLHLRV